MAYPFQWYHFHVILIWLDLVSERITVCYCWGNGDTQCRNKEPEFVNLLRSTEIDFPAGRAGTTTLFDVQARQAT